MRCLHVNITYSYAQVGLFKPLRVTSGAVGASLIGGAAVFVAGLVSSYAAVKGYSLARSIAVKNSAETATHSVELVVKDLLISAAVSTIVFRALGGKFSAVLPSNLIQPGAFAKQAIPVNMAQYASKNQKKIIQDLGRKNGCHTCGRRSKSIQYSADHQPPTKLIKNAEQAPPQWYYPQCNKCSNMQGPAVNGISSKIVITHPFALRPYHIFLPVPLGLAYLKASSSHYQSTVADVQTNTEQQLHSTGSSDLVAAPVAEKPKELPTIKRDSISVLGRPLAELIASFPLLIVWDRILTFLQSFHPCGRFHITVWTFSIIAALGCF